MSRLKRIKRNKAIEILAERWVEYYSDEAHDYIVGSILHGTLGLHDYTNAELEEELNEGITMEDNGFKYKVKE